MLYCCRLSDNVSLIGNEPRSVLLRLYGQIIRENPETVLTDSVIFALLAEKKLGPRLFGVFTEGRVEEYVPVSPDSGLILLIHLCDFYFNSCFKLRLLYHAPRTCVHRNTERVYHNKCKMLLGRAFCETKLATNVDKLFTSRRIIRIIAFALASFSLMVRAIRCKYWCRMVQVWL